MSSQEQDNIWKFLFIYAMIIMGFSVIMSFIDEPLFNNAYTKFQCEYFGYFNESHKQWCILKGANIN